MTSRSYTDVSAPEYNPNGLFDVAIARCKLKNDAALAAELEVAPSIVSKIRHHALPVGPSMVIRVHDITGMPIDSIRAYLGLAPRSKQAPTQ